MIDTLLARADSLNDELLADEHADGPPRQRTDVHPRRAAGLPHRRLGALPRRPRPAQRLTDHTTDPREAPDDHHLTRNARPSLFRQRLSGPCGRR